MTTRGSGCCDTSSDGKPLCDRKELGSCVNPRGTGSASGEHGEPDSTTGEDGVFLAADYLECHRVSRYTRSSQEASFNVL